MTEAQQDKTKAVPEGGHVSANMARQNGKLWVEPQAASNRTEAAPSRFRPVTALLVSHPNSDRGKAICPEFDEWPPAE